MRIITSTSLCLCLLSVGSVVAEDDVAEALNAAKSDYRIAIQNSKKTLLEEIAKERKKVVQSSKPTAEKVRLETQLEGEQQDFEKDGTLPKSAGLKGAVKKFEDGNRAARAKADKAFDRAAKAYDKAGDLAAAKRVLAEKDQFFNSDQPPKYVCLVSVGTRKIIGVDGASLQQGARIVQWDLDKEATNHHWELVPVEADWWYIKNRKSGMSMGIEGGSKEDGAPVVQWPGEPESHNHHWKMVRVEDNNKKTDVVVFVNRNSGKILSLGQDSSERGVRTIQSKETKGARYQQWLLVPVE